MNRQQNLGQKVLHYLPWVLVFGAALLAAGDFEPQSTSRRGRGAEAMFHGVKVIFGAEEASSPSIVWLARVLIVVGVGLGVGLFFDRRTKALG